MTKSTIENMIESTFHWMLVNVLKTYRHVTIVFEIKIVKKFIPDNDGQERLNSFFAAMITAYNV